MPTSLNGNTLLFREPGESTNVSLVGSLNNLSLGGSVLSDLANPTNDGDAINKYWYNGANNEAFLTRCLNGDPVTIVCVGSSSTVGVVQSSPTVIADVPYPLRLKQLLDIYFNHVIFTDPTPPNVYPTPPDPYPGTNITVINEGQSGATTVNLIASFDTRVTDNNPDVVIQMMGVNDAIDATNKLEPDVFEANLQTLADLYKKGGYLTYFATTNPVKDTTVERNYRLTLFNEIIKKVAMINNFPIIDLYGDIQRISYYSKYFSIYDILTTDDTHPSQEGYLTMAGIVFGNMVPSVKVYGDTAAPLVAAPYQYVNPDVVLAKLPTTTAGIDLAVNPYKFSYQFNRSFPDQYCMISVMNYTKGSSVFTFDVKNSTGGDSTFTYRLNGITQSDVSISTYNLTTVGNLYTQIATDLQEGLNIFEFGSGTVDNPLFLTGGGFARALVTALIFKPPVVYYNNDYLVVQGTDLTIPAPGGLPLQWGTTTESNGISVDAATTNTEFVLNPNKLYIINVALSFSGCDSLTFGLYEIGSLTPVSQLYTVNGSNVAGGLTSTTSISIFYNTTTGPSGSPIRPLRCRIIAIPTVETTFEGVQSSVTIYNIN